MVAGEVTLEIRTEDADDGHHGIYFNRGAAGSQAYTRQFGEVSPLDSGPARRWLSRGLAEALSAFIRQAQDAGFGLRGAFYEFTHAQVLAELLKAHERGADVQLVVAVPSGSRNRLPDDPAGANIAAVGATHWTLPKDAAGKTKTLRLASIIVGRTRPPISHNKFLVLLRGEKPVAVWTGSTNVTDGALYGQSNVGHVVRDEALAASYLAYWQQLHENPDDATLTEFDEMHTPLPDGAPAANVTTPLFSPRLSAAAAAKAGSPYALDWYADRMREAKQAVFLTAPFGVSARLQAVFKVDRDYPRYVLLNDENSAAVELARADPDNQITAGAFIGEGGWRQFLEEHLTGLNVHAPYVHTKYLLIDPLTEAPLVITGSANFSDGSMDTNDENMLAIAGDTRVADIYLTEFMRLFTHLRFRGTTVGDSTTARAPDPKEPEISGPLYLDDTAAWTEPYFAVKDPKSKERRLFRAPL